MLSLLLFRKNSYKVFFKKSAKEKSIEKVSQFLNMNNVYEFIKI